MNLSAPRLIGTAVSCLAVLGGCSFAESVLTPPSPPDFPLDQPLPEHVRERALADTSSRPLALSEDGDPEPPPCCDDPDLARGVRLRRGIALTAYQRLSLYARSTSRKRRDPAVIEELARPELWIVVFPFAPERARALVGESSQWSDDPRDRLDEVLHPDSEVLWPHELRVVGGSGELEPLWVRRDDFRFARSFYDEWIDGRGLVAAYPLADPSFTQPYTRLEVEYRVDDHPVAREDATIYWRDVTSKWEWHRALSGN